MVWEIWNRITKEIVWLIRENGGIALRVDPDSLVAAGLLSDPETDLCRRHHRHHDPESVL